MYRRPRAWTWWKAAYTGTKSITHTAWPWPGCSKLVIFRDGASSHRWQPSPLHTSSMHKQLSIPVFSLHIQEELWCSFGHHCKPNIRLLRPLPCGYNMCKCVGKGVVSLDVNVDMLTASYTSVSSFWNHSYLATDIGPAEAASHLSYMHKHRQISVLGLDTFQGPVCLWSHWSCHGHSTHSSQPAACNTSCLLYPIKTSLAVFSFGLPALPACSLGWRANNEGVLELLLPATIKKDCWSLQPTKALIGSLHILQQL